MPVSPPAPAVGPNRGLWREVAFGDADDVPQRPPNSGGGRERRRLAAAVASAVLWWCLVSLLAQGSSAAVDEGELFTELGVSGGESHR